MADSEGKKGVSFPGNTPEAEKPPPSSVKKIPEKENTTTINTTPATEKTEARPPPTKSSLKASTPTNPSLKGLTPSELTLPSSSTEKEQPCKRTATQTNTTPEEERVEEEPSNVSSEEGEPNTNDRGLNTLETPEGDQEPLEPAEKQPAQSSTATQSAQSSAQGKSFLGDPTLPHLLRIGIDQNSEYIELKAGVIQSHSNFNVHTIGSGAVELRTKYGITESNGYRAMQRAFGVKNQGGKPPLLDYIKKQCQFVGFDLVREALRKRIETLGESSKLKGNTIQARNEKHRITILQGLLDQMNVMPSVPCPTSTPSVAPPTTTTSPCIGDISLLRDLVYLVVMLQGIASPEVKKQLQTIPIKSLLRAAEKNNVQQSKLLIKQLMKVLEELLSKDTSSNTDDSLKKIYSALKPGTPLPETITVDLILLEIGRLMSNITSLKQEQDSLSAILKKLSDSLDKKHEELLKAIKDMENLLSIQSSNDSDAVKKLRIELNIALGKLAGANAKYEDALKKLKDSEKQTADEKQSRNDAERSLEDARRILEEAKQHVQDLEDELKRLRDSYNETDEEIQGLLTTIQGHKDTFTMLDGKLKKDLDDKEKTIKELQDKLDELMKKLEKGSVNKKAVNLQIKKLTGNIATLRKDKETLNDDSKAIREELTKTIKGLDTQVKELQASIAAKPKTSNSSTSTDEGSTSTGESATTQTNNSDIFDLLKQQMKQAQDDITRLEEEANRLQDEYNKTEEEYTAVTLKLQGELDKCSSDNKGLLAQIKKLEQEIRDLTTEVETLRASSKKSSSELTEELTKARVDLATLQGESSDTSTLIATLRAQLEKAQKDLEAVRKALEDYTGTDDTERAALESKLKEAEANVESLTKQLEEKESTGTASSESFTKEKEALLAKIAALESELATLKASSSADLTNRNSMVLDLKKQLEKAQTDLEAVRKALEEYRGTDSGKRAELEEELKAAKAKVETLTGDLNAARAALTKQSDDTTASTNIISTQTNIITTKDGIIQSLKAELEKAHVNTKSKTEDFDKRIQELQDRLKQAEEDKLASTTSSSTTLESKEAELASLRSKLAEATKAKETAEANVKTLEANLATTTTDRDRLQTELDEANEKLRNATKQAADIRAKIASIENDVKAMKNQTNKNTQASKASTNTFTKEIEALKKQLAEEKEKRTSLQTEYDALAAQLAAMKVSLETSSTEKGTKKAEIDRLTALLVEKEETIEEQKTRIAALEAQLLTAKEGMSSAVTSLQEQLQKKNTAYKSDLASLTDQKDATIRDLRAELKSLQDARTANTLAHETALNTLRKSLAAAESTVTKQKVTIDEQMEEIARLKAKATELESNTKLQVETAVSDTKKRLQNLLSWILIDPSLQEKAADFVTKGTIDEAEAKQLFTADLCDFFSYLSNLTTVQVQLLTPIFAKFGNNRATISKDIFESYLDPGMPKVDSTPDEQFALFKEIGDIFQKFFLWLSAKTPKPESLSGTPYPLLTKVLTNYKINEPTKLGVVMKTVVSIELKSTGDLASYVIEPLGIRANTLKFESADKKTDTDASNQKIPMTILAIKFIQLLNQVLQTKYKLRERCETSFPSK